MIAVPLALFAGCLAVNSASDRITADDLAPAFPGLQSVAAGTALGWAPAPGIHRIFRLPELRRIAARFSVAPPETEICVERPVVPLDKEILLRAMRRQLPETVIQILDFSRRSVPVGEIEFPATALREGPTGSIWNGYVRFGATSRFPVWARVTVAKIVARGEKVLVEVQNGAAHLEIEARAERSGAAGEIIPLRNLASQKSFLGRVEGKGRVSVDASAGWRNP